MNQFWKWLDKLTGVKRLTREAYVRCKFLPKADITSFELACIFAFTSGESAPGLGILIPRSSWLNMDAALKRHFVQVGDET